MIQNDAISKHLSSVQLGTARRHITSFALISWIWYFATRLCSVESVPILMISSHLAVHLRPGDTHTNCINHDVHTRLVATFSSKESLMSGTIYRLQLISLLCQLLRVH